jgi:hypothetical protein
MKVKIGPYRSFFGPYQLAEKLCFWVKPIEDEYGMKDAPEWVDNFGDWLAHGKFNSESILKTNETLLYRFLLWIDKKKQRKISVKIDRWDTWSMDDTLAYIILPMLKQLKETKHGAPPVDDKDVPNHLRSTSAEPKKNDWDTDSNHFARWDWILGEMIFAFDSKVGEDKDWEDQFHSGEVDLISVAADFDENGKPLSFELKNGPDHTHKWDNESYKRYHDRIQNGFRLFGKYYTALWD